MISRCEGLKRTINDLKSICNTHERTLETFRQEILNLQMRTGTLDLSYQGEEFEVMQGEELEVIQQI